MLGAEAQVVQVGTNFADAAAGGPAMFGAARLDQAGGVDGSQADPIAELGRRAAAAGMRTASLDEVLCITAA